MKLKCTECGCRRIQKDKHSDGHVYWTCANCQELLAHEFPNGQLEVF